jgi:putative membrane protein
VVTANKIDIDAGKLAKSRTKNKEVSKFAQLMITDHTAVNKQAGALAKKLGVKPADSDTSKSLKAGAADNVKNLKGLKGTAFDKAYVDHEVAYHQAVLDAIDKVLIPGIERREPRI